LAGARIKRELLYELNGAAGPRSWWLDRQKIAINGVAHGVAHGIVELNPAPASNRSSVSG
jgi:hypothetical protein